MSRIRYVILASVTLISWWVGDKISWQIRTDRSAGSTLSDVMDRFWFDLQSPFHISWNTTDMLVGAGFAAAILMMWAYHVGARKATRPGEEHGSAKWASPRDIRPYVGNRSNDILFTRTESLSLDSRKTQRNLNVLVIGSSGSGKSRYFVMPNLHQGNTSYVVTDPKGEVLAATGNKLLELGYEIRCLNLVDFARSDTFNPLAYFNPDQAEVDCAILTENFITNTTGKKPSDGGDFWEKAERALLTALVAMVYFTKGEKGTLLDVVELLSMMTASEQNEEALSPVDELFLATKEYIADCDNNPDSDPDGNKIIEGLRFACSQYNVYTQGAGETKKSVIISLGVRMAPLHMAPMRRILGSDTIKADQIGMRPTALFLVIPDTHQAFNFLASIFYETFFEKNIYIADHSGGRLPVPVQCYMDEFANIGKMPSFERKIAVMRSRGISTSVILQNYSQGKALYKDDWETIVGNCDSLLFLGGNEGSTTEFISKRLGKETITQEDNSDQRGAQGSWSRSYRSSGRELMTADEISRLPGNECLYFLRGVPPFRSRKLAAPPEGYFEYMPAEVPQALSPEENPLLAPWESRPEHNEIDSHDGEFADVVDDPELAELAAMSPSDLDEFGGEGDVEITVVLSDGRQDRQVIHFKDLDVF